MREYRAEDQADKAQAEAITAAFAAAPAGAVPRTPDELIEFARLTAQAMGKPLIKEQIAILDEEIAHRCSSARVWVREHGEIGWDWETWGRVTYVLESVLSFLQRLDADPAAKDYLSKKFRRGVIRDAKGDDDREKIPVDNSGDQTPA